MRAFPNHSAADASTLVRRVNRDLSEVADSARHKRHVRKKITAPKVIGQYRQQLGDITQSILSLAISL